MSRLALHVLGPPRIELDGQAISLSHQKAVALLVYLGVTRQRHTRQALAALLWPDYDPAGARGEVRRMVWVLNKSLGQGWLEVNRQTVMLPPQPDLWLDIDRFQGLLAATQSHGHPPSEACPACLEPLTAAVALARGDFLAGFSLADSPDFDTWQAFEAESLRRELAGALERLVQLLMQRHETLRNQAVNYARRWLALDPLNEPAHRQLMRLYVWAGQPAAAIQQYQACVRVLVDDLGVPPTAETTALYEAIKANRLPPPTGVAEQWRVEVTAISALSPTPAIPPHHLPSQATPFIGRETALDGLQQRLADPEVRLITIIGPGGIGKSRLALALAERQLRPRPPATQPATSFADGVYFISLAPISSAETIAQTIAEGVAFALSSAEEPAVQLLTYLRHKQMLLVLDNFEHLLAGSELVSQILQAAAGVKILITSRERLNLANETLWPISGLNFAKLASVDEALAYDAVRLFMQRARLVRPDFALRAEELPHLERILQAVWGMPLAIELAASWLNMLSMAEIASELSHSLDLLESELRDTPGRHRSMRLVFDRSWERLDAEQQVLFKTLAIFRGGFTREAARQVTGASLRMLAGLVNKSLLTSQPDTGRYELHELLRQYALEQLASDPAAKAAAQQAHAAYYAAFMQQSWADLRSSQQQAALAELEQDIENIRGAWRYWLAERNSAELLKFMDSFWFVHEIRGWHHAGIALFAEAAAQPRPVPGDDAAMLVRGKALGYAGYYTGIVGNPERGWALSQAALAIIRPLEQPEALEYALLSAALNSVYLGDLNRLYEAAQEWGQIGQAIGDRWGTAMSFNFLTTALSGRQGLAEGREKIDLSLQIFGQEIGEYLGLTWAALVRGQLALRQGAYAEAKTFFERSLNAAQALNYRRTTQQSYDNLGDVAFYLGEVEQAERYFRLSLEVSEETGQTREMLGTLYDLARVWAAQGNQAEAVEVLAVVLHHPLSILPLFLRTEGTILREAAERFRSSLEADLAPETYQAAWARGLALQLEAVVANLLREVVTAPKPQGLGFKGMPPHPTNL
jgi:predicted ATPase/DNA-binding SARP family transcriptional activator